MFALRHFSANGDTCRANRVLHFRARRTRALRARL